MKMPEPVGYLSQYNLTMLEQGYPQTIVMLKGAKRDLPLYDKQALIDLLESAAKALRDIDALHNAGLVDVTVDALRSMKEKL